MNKHTELLRLYDRLFYQSVNKIRSGDTVSDEMLGNPIDNRRGLTLLIRPADQIADKIFQFQQEMKHIDEKQYYQPVNDLHVTALSIISCYDGFDFTELPISEYANVISESMKGIREIGLSFRGVTSSREAVMIQGFPADNGLEILRNQLRKNFSLTNLQQSIDSRYKLSTAHITAIRFRNELKSPDRFASVMQHYRQTDFGHMHIKSLELVYNDWYQDSSVVKVLQRFLL